MTLVEFAKMGEEMNEESSEMGDLESRWPKDGDRLFVEDAWAYDAQVVCHPGELSYRLPKGYKRAGDILVDRAATDVIDRPNVIYAALFCYRQCIELFLKVLIDGFRSGGSQIATGHDLAVLWDKLMVIAEKRGVDDSIGVSAVRDIVMEMHQADRKADGFRYPTGVDGAPFPFGDRGIDLANLREVMQGVQNFFECVYLEFSHQDDIAAEIASVQPDLCY